MAGRVMTSPAASPIEAYLAELAELLHGPRRRRARILAELRDGLHEAAEAYRTSASSPAAAERQAVAGFGSPRAVADAFAGELATAYARRTIAAYIVTGPLVGIWWLLLLQPHPWRTGLIALLAAIPVLPLVAIAIATAAGTLASTGRLMRWLPETGPRRAIAVITGLAALVMTADTAVITFYTLSDMRLRPLAALAIAASAARIGCTLLTLRHTAAIRRALADTEVAGDDDVRR